MRKLIAILLPALLFCTLASMARAQSNAQTTPQSDARKAFEKMKTLAGSWQGTVMGMSINITMHVASSGSTILSEATADGKRPPDHEITTFYMEGDRLLATHYCDAGNRSHMEGKVSPDGNTIEFNTVDVAGSMRGGFTKRLVFTLIDADHYGLELTYMMPDGKAVEARGQFQRTK